MTQAETKWTKGPWKWSRPDYDAEHVPPDNCASYGLYAEDNPVLSGCGNCGNIFYNEANGHLIAAAPDIAEAAALFDAAVKAALHALNSNGIPCPAGIALAAEKARAALRKARGE